MEVENRARILLDPSDLCRICLTTNQSNHCVFGAKQNDFDSAGTSVSEKLRLCSGVEVSLLFKASSPGFSLYCLPPY